MTSLFRPQVAAERADPLGQSLAWTPPAYRIVAGAVLAASVFACAAVLNLDFTDKLSMPGVVQVGARPTLVEAAVRGTLTGFDVATGDVVAAGDVVARIDRSVRLAQGQSAAELERAGLSQRLAAVRVERTAYADLRARQRALRMQAQQRDSARLTFLQSQSRVLEEQLALAQADAERFQHLASQRWVGAVESARARQALLGRRKALLEHRGQVRAMADQLSAAQQELEGFDAESALGELGYTHRLDDLRQEINALAQSEQVLVTAPHAGRVADLTGQPGDSVAPGSRLLTLLPRHAPPRVELWVPSTGAGRVRPGLAVRLRFSGYPHQDYGTGTGVVEHISDVVHRVDPVPAFRARVRIDGLPPKVRHLPAGMTVIADVQLARKALWRWLLDPLQGVLNHL